MAANFFFDSPIALGRDQNERWGGGMERIMGMTFSRTRSLMTGPDGRRLFWGINYRLLSGASFSPI